MKRTKTSSSDSDESSDDTAEMQVVVPVKTRRRSKGTCRDAARSDSTSPVLGASSSVRPVRSPLRSRALPQISLMDCIVKYIKYLLQQHEVHDRTNLNFLSLWHSRFGRLSENCNGYDSHQLSQDGQDPTATASTAVAPTSTRGSPRPTRMSSSGEESSDTDPYVRVPEPSSEELDSSNGCDDFVGCTDGETPEKERSDPNAGVMDEGVEAAGLISSVHLHDEASDDSLLYNFSELITSTSQNNAQDAPIPASEQRMEQREEKNRKRRLRAGEAKILNNVQRIYVPTDKVGRIVGKRGRQIKEIEQETGATIKLDNKSKKPSTEVELSGSPDQIRAASQKIRDMIRSYKKQDTGKE